MVSLILLVSLFHLSKTVSCSDSFLHSWVSWSLYKCGNARAPMKSLSIRYSEAAIRQTEVCTLCALNVDLNRCLDNALWTDSCLVHDPKHLQSISKCASLDACWSFHSEGARRPAGAQLQALWYLLISIDCLQECILPYVVSLLKPSSPTASAMTRCFPVFAHHVSCYVPRRRDWLCWKTYVLIFVRLSCRFRQFLAQVI